MGKYAAVIFDMDGVISDTQSVYASVESRLLAEHGISLTPEEITVRFAGRTSHDLMCEIFPHHSDEARKVIADERYARIARALETNIVPIEGTIEVIRALALRALPLAVASASRVSIIELITGTLGVRDAFRALVSSQNVPKGKPFPDVFLEAARQLGVGSEQCIVVEDSPHGMEAAKRAGMYCIGLVRSGNGEGLPADVVVDDLPKADWSTLLGIQ